MQDHKRIEFANSLRGLAAISVIISHYFGVFWLNREAVESLINAPLLPQSSYAMPSYLLWLHSLSIFNWGAYGVALFFLISGFVIPFTLKRSSLSSFLTGRAFRILPTYAFGFTITLAFIYVSSHYFMREWPFSMNEIAIHYVPGIRDIVWSRNIDGIIWTLEIEIKFYLLCALLIHLFRRNSNAVFLAPAFLFVLNILISQKIPTWAINDASAYKLAMSFALVSQYILYMFIGVIFHYLHQGALDATKAFTGVGVIFLMFALNCWAGPYSGNLILVWSYAFALITFSVAYTYPRFFRSNTIFNFFADISYPIYVIHGVAGYVALRIMLDRGFKAWLSLLLVTVACIFFSWLIHVFIEAPSQRLGKYITNRIPRADISSRKQSEIINIL